MQFSLTFIMHCDTRRRVELVPPDIGLALSCWRCRWCEVRTN